MTNGIRLVLSWLKQPSPISHVINSGHSPRSRPFPPVYGELLFRQATWHATLLYPFLYVIDSKCALKLGEAQLQAGGGVGVEVGAAGHVWQSHIYKDACGLTKQKVYQA
jgi:hypothetical protein